MLTRPFHSSSERRSMLIPLISLSLPVISEGGDLREAGSLIQLLATSENTAQLFRIPQRTRHGLKGERGQRLVSHFVFRITGEIWLFACQKGNSEGHGRDGGHRRSPLKQFCSLYSSCQVKQSGDAAAGCKLQKVSGRSTKGFDRCHLSPAGSAVRLYHQRGNIPFWCLHNRSISISQDVIPFTSRSHRGLTPPKNPQSVF